MFSKNLVIDFLNKLKLRIKLSIYFNNISYYINLYKIYNKFYEKLYKIIL